MKSITQIRKLISEGKIKVTPLMIENAIAAIDRQDPSYFSPSLSCLNSDDEE